MLGGRYRVVGLLGRGGTSQIVFVLFSSTWWGARARPAPRSRILSDPTGPFSAKHAFQRPKTRLPTKKSPES